MYFTKALDLTPGWMKQQDRVLQFVRINEFQTDMTDISVYIRKTMLKFRVLSLRYAQGSSDLDNTVSLYQMSCAIYVNVGDHFLVQVGLEYTTPCFAGQ